MKFNLAKINNNTYYKELEKRVANSRNKISSTLYTELKKNTPVKTGHAKRNWKLDINVNENLDVITNSATYLKYVNDGTAKIRPRRFIEKSIKDTKRKEKL